MATKKNFKSPKNATNNNATADLANFMCEHMSFAATEAYKLLRTNIIFSFADNDICHKIGITSSMPGEGKSLTSINLAYSMAQYGKRVLLIDADLRIPSISTKLSIPSSPGLSNLLVGLDNVRDTIQRYTTKESGVWFDVMPAGDIPPNPSELLGSERMQKLTNLLAPHYDYILFDLTPIGSVSDALVVSRLTHGMLMVVRQDYCQRPVLADCVKQLQFVEAKILGFVLNCANDSSAGYGKHKGKYYGKKYAKSYKYYQKS